MNIQNDPYVKAFGIKFPLQRCIKNKYKKGFKVCNGRFRPLFFDLKSYR